MECKTVFSYRIEEQNHADPTQEPVQVKLCLTYTKDGGVDVVTTAGQRLVGLTKDGRVRRYRVVGTDFPNDSMGLIQLAPVKV